MIACLFRPVESDAWQTRTLLPQTTRFSPSLTVIDLRNERLMLFFLPMLQMIAIWMLTPIRDRGSARLPVGRKRDRQTSASRGLFPFNRLIESISHYFQQILFSRTPDFLPSVAVSHVVLIIIMRTCFAVGVRSSHRQKKPPATLAVIFSAAGASCRVSQATRIVAS